MRFFLIVLVMFVSMSACNTENKDEIAHLNISADLLHSCVETLNKAIVHDIFSPPVASRIYTYPIIGAYEVLIHSDSTYRSFVGQLNGLDKLPKPNKRKKYSWKFAAAITYLEAAKGFVFSEHYLETHLKILKERYKNQLGDERYQNSLNYGVEMANAIIEYSKSDNYLESRGYPKHGIKNLKKGEWIPTPPNYMDAIEPHWNRIRPFTLDSADQFVPEKATPYNMSKDSQFYREVKELYDSTVSISNEEIEIAKFWDCNPFVMENTGHVMSSVKKITPGGHWVGIAGIAAKSNNSTMLRTAEVYAMTCVTLADAFISCWDEKYRSNLIRPETVININIDPNWKPILQTPPFPEYTSGHSVASASAARVLSLMLGEEFHFVDTTEVVFGLPEREFKSFQEASEEAAASRFYGGIHYRPAIDNGIVQGKAIGNFIFSKIKTRE